MENMDDFADMEDYQYLFDQSNVHGLYDDDIAGGIPHEYYDYDPFEHDTGTFNRWSSFKFMFPQCFYPTTDQVLYTVMLRCIGVALLLRLAVLLRLPAFVVHILSSVLGLVLVWYQFNPDGVKLFFAFEVLGYLLYRLAPRWRGLIMSAFVLIFLFVE